MPRKWSEKWIRANIHIAFFMSMSLSKALKIVENRSKMQKIAEKYAFPHPIPHPPRILDLGLIASSDPYRYISRTSSSVPVEKMALPESDACFDGLFDGVSCRPGTEEEFDDMAFDEEEDGSEEYGLYGLTREDIDVSTRIHPVEPLAFVDETGPEGDRLISKVKSTYSFTLTSANGKVTLDDYAVSRFIGLNHIAFSEDGTMYRFNSMYYEPLPDVAFDKIVYGITRMVELRPPSVSTIGNLRNLARAENLVSDLALTSEDSYRGDSVVPFQNGIYNADRDLLLPFTPSVFCTRLYGATYDPRIRQHSIEAVYRRIIPDPATLDFFFEMVGYILFSPTQTIPAMFCIYGPSETGKSALGKAIEAALGRDNISHLDLAQITEKFSTAEMEGKLLNMCGETGTGVVGGKARADGQMLKQLSEGAMISVQRKNQRPFDMVATAKLMFLTNSIPNFGDTSSGIYRRLYIIPCRHKQRTSERIYDKLTEETAVSWLVNQALKGYKRFMQRGGVFATSAEMEEEMVAFRVQEPIQDFLQACYGTLKVEEVREELLKTPSMAFVYDEYVDYVSRTGGKPYSMRKFSEILRNEYGLVSKVRHVGRGIDRTTESYFALPPGAEDEKEEE